VGLNYSSPITNSYYDSETSGQSDDDGRGEPKTTAEMKKQETYADWDFDDIWGIDENNGYPYLWEFFIDIGNISGAITSAVYNETKSLSATVEPNNATIKTIAWSVTNGNATISGNNITFTKAGQLTIKATITNGLGNGSDYTQNFNINVAKAAGTFVATTALNATYTPTLTLANITLPANYAWSAPTTSLSAGSNQTFAATYTDPSGNYNPATGNITVNIAKANGTGTVAITGWTYGQAANAPTISGQTAEYGVPSYTYSAQGANDYTATVPTAVGSYTVKATFAATANYNEHTATADFAIAKANGAGTVEIAGWTHGQAANAPTVSGQTAEYGEPSYTYSAKDANDYTATVPTNAGSYTVKATFAATANYNEHTATADFAIAKANGTGTVEIAGWTHGQAANAPTISGQTAEYGEPSYTYTAKDANDYTATVPTNAGSYTVKATFAETANYNEHTATADFAIAKANGTGTVAIAGWTYGQPANAPTISGQTAEYGEPSYTYSAKDANDYTATVPTAVGSYTVKATFAETANYNEHTATADFAIAAIPTYAVTVTNGTGSGNYEAGATVTLTANAPEAGMEFKNWDITPAVTFTAGSAATPEAEFTMPAEAVTATAVYEAIPINNHLITVTIEGNGIANANVVSAPQGTQITLTATPNSGNRFVRWNVVSGGITLSNATTATATFTIPNNAVAVKAVFEVIPTPILPSQIATGNKAVQTSNGINLTATTNATVEIFNLKGSLISRQNFASGVHAIQLGHLPKGMYIVKVSFGSSKQVLRMPIK
jgi:hypothetical protein